MIMSYNAEKCFCFGFAESSSFVAFKKMNKFEYYAVIKYLQLKGMGQLQIYQKLMDTLRESAPLYVTVKRWVGDFQHGRESVRK